MVRLGFLEQLRDPFCLHLTDRVKAGFIVSAVGTALFCYDTTRGLFQFQFQANIWHYL